MNRFTLSRPALLLGLLLAGFAAQAQSPWPSQSIYNVEAVLVNQSGQQHGLEVYHGHPVLITMFYGSCPATCPLLMDTIRSVERTLDERQRKGLRVLMISIDPERDTTQALATLSKDRHVDPSRWTLAHTDSATVRKLAAVLNIQYRRLPDGEYSHSSIITVLSPQGEILQQSSVLGRADADLVAALGMKEVTGD